MPIRRRHNHHHRPRRHPRQCLTRNLLFRQRLGVILLGLQHLLGDGLLAGALLARRRLALRQRVAVQLVLVVLLVQLGEARDVEELEVLRAVQVGVGAVQGGSTKGVS